MSTQVQAAVSGALQALGAEPVPAEGGVVGGPQKVNITEATVEKVQALVGTTLIVESNGEIEEQKPLD
jgi:hypothetical protein